MTSLVYRFPDASIPEAMFASVEGGGRDGPREYRYVGSNIMFWEPGERHAMVTTSDEFNPHPTSLSQAEVVWQDLVRNIPESVRATLPTGPWYLHPAEVEVAGYRNHLASQDPPDILSNRFNGDTFDALRRLHEVIGSPLAALSTLLLDADGLRAVQALRGERHAVVFARDLLGAPTAAVATASTVGLNLRLLMDEFTPESLHDYALTLGGDTPYLGPLYLLDLPPVTSVPVVGLRFEGITVLVGAHDNQQQTYLTRILHNAIRTGDFGEGGVRDWVTSRITARFERSLQRYNRDLLDSAHHNVQHLRNEVANLLSRYLTANENLRSANLLLEQGERETDERGIERVRRMVRNGVITGIRMNEATISVSTKHIYILDTRSGVWHDIGRFEMRIDLDTGQYRFLNQTRNYTRHHPHVFAGGDPCLGTLAEAVPQMRTNRDWPAFIELGLLYLESVNYGDSHMNLHRFPVVPDPEAVGLTPHEGDSPIHGLPIPELPQGDEDFGVVGEHCFIRRSGQFYFHLPGSDNYYDYHGNLVDTSTWREVNGENHEPDGLDENPFIRVEVRRGEPYSPNDYDEHLVLVDEEGVEYHWDEGFGRHLDEGGIDPEGYDGDGLNDDGNSRFEQRLYDFADAVATRLQVDYGRDSEYARNFAELDIHELERFHSLSNGDETLAAELYVAEEEQRRTEALEQFAIDLRDWLRRSGHEWHANRMEGMDFGELEELESDARGVIEAAAELLLQRESEPEPEPEEEEEVA